MVNDNAMFTQDDLSVCYLLLVTMNANMNLAEFDEGRGRGRGHWCTCNDLWTRYQVAKN